MVFRTTDAGETWTSTVDPTRIGQLSAVSFIDAYTGTAVGSNGLILHTTTGGSTWIGEEPLPAEPIPTEMKLYQNYPNPFNPETKIRFSIVSTQHTTLTVYDLLGRKVVVLVDEVKQPGRYEVAFSAGGGSGSAGGGVAAVRGGKGLASGVYIYRLTSGGYVETRKMLLLK